MDLKGKIVIWDAPNTHKETVVAMYPWEGGYIVALYKV